MPAATMARPRGKAKAKASKPARAKLPRGRYVTMKISAIKIPSGRAMPGPTESLQQSIAAVGLLNPLTVSSSGELLAGFKRLAALQALGAVSAPVVVVKLDEAHEQLATIDENLARQELTALERSNLTAQRKRIYEALNPETKRGGDRRPEQTATRGRLKSFAKDTAEKTGTSERTVRRAARIAEHLDAEAAKTIESTPIADSQRQLEELASLPAEEQRQVAETIASGEAETVAEARHAREPEEPAGGISIGQMQERFKPVVAAVRAIHKALGDAGAMVVINGELVADDAYLERLIKDGRGVIAGDAGAWAAAIKPVIVGLEALEPVAWRFYNQNAGRR